MTSVDTPAPQLATKENPRSSLRYAAEIDGLRAIAVLAVVFFHAKLSCPGGYVGVDVFFVISGFLITSILLKDIQKSSQFKPFDFWERRIRRILPALTVTLLAVIVACWFIFLPTDLMRLGRAIIAQTFFGANIYHYQLDNYFGPRSETLPLLHTWSLALEEQYYIVLPIAMLLIARIKQKFLAPSMVIGCVISFAACVMLTPGFQNFSFYMLPTRAWELLIGSILAVYPAWGEKSPRALREIISLTGLAAIAAAVFLFTADTAFPGYAALLPCAGTAAFIWANRSSDKTLGGKFLALPPIVFVGKVSYSFYLLHWPMLVFSQYWFRSETRTAWKLGLVGVTFVLAVISWAAVETPIRKKKLFDTRKSIFALAIVSSLVLIAAGLTLSLTRGFPSRLTPEAQAYAAARDRKSFESEVELPAAQRGDFPSVGAKTGQAKFILWGDSHAMALVPAIEDLAKQNNIRGLVATHSSTAPLLKFVSRGKYAMNDESPAFNDAVWKTARDPNVELIILAGYWSSYTAYASDEFDRCMKATVAELVAAGKKVVIVRDVPDQECDITWELVKAANAGASVEKIGVTEKRHRAVNEKPSATFDQWMSRDEASRSAALTIVDPATLFMDQAGLLRAAFDGKSMYRDQRHLSPDGARHLKPLFESHFTALAKSPPASQSR